MLNKILLLLAIVGSLVMINTAEAASRLVFQYDDLGTVGGLHIAADLSRDLGPDFPGPWSSRFLGPLSPRFLGLGPSVPRTLLPYRAHPKSLRWHRRACLDAS